MHYHPLAILSIFTQSQIWNLSDLLSAGPFPSFPSLLSHHITRGREELSWHPHICGIWTVYLYGTIVRGAQVA
jgi:hypothetical protein